MINDVSIVLLGIVNKPPWARARGKINFLDDHPLGEERGEEGEDDDDPGF